MKISTPIFSLVAVISTALVFSACTPTATTTSSPTSTPQAQVTPAGEPHIPFKLKEYKEVTRQTGNVTETVRASSFDVELTQEEEQQYYGSNPEYADWNSAYFDQILHKYPPGWGYYAGSMLLSDDSGANSRTVVSMHFARVLAEDSKIWQYEKTLNAEMGYTTPYTNITYTKTDEFETINGMKVAKYTKQSDEENLIDARYVIEQPDGWYLDVSVNAMNLDLYEENRDTIDQIIKSSTFVPYVYK